MGQGDVHRPHSAGARSGGRPTGEADRGRTTVRAHDLDIAEREAAPPAGSQRLETGFLGREPRGERLRFITAVPALGELGGREDALTKLAAVLRQDARDPSRLDHIQTKSDDHRGGVCAQSRGGASS
jgi:hypothetical protein